MKTAIATLITISNALEEAIKNTRDASRHDSATFSSLDVALSHAGELCSVLEDALTEATC